MGEVIGLRGENEEKEEGRETDGDIRRQTEIDGDRRTFVSSVVTMLTSSPAAFK